MTLDVARCELLVTLADGFRGGVGTQGCGGAEERVCEKEVEACPGCGGVLL